MKKRLGVNIDHVATLRNARGEKHPDPYTVALDVLKAGADSITVHLREDRRHIKDDDVRSLKNENILPLNLEMAATKEMKNFSLEILPSACCIVPERREELTTEGGLDVRNQMNYLNEFLPALNNKTQVSLFVDPDPDQIKAAKELGVSAVEFATRYANKLIELREDLKKRAPKDSIFDPPFSTLQVGGIFGGIAHNVIADKCHINWETRPVVKEDGIFLNDQIDKYANEVLLPEMKNVFQNSKITKEIIGEVTGFDRVKKSEACELVSSLTGDNSREVVSFGTEAGLFQEIGISTVVCGPGSIEQAHKVDEFIELNELKKCINFLNGIKSKSISN